MHPVFNEDLEHIFAHTHDLWGELQGRRIFLTGGTGFFGTWILESLSLIQQKLNFNLEVVVLTRDPESFKMRLPHLAKNSLIKFHTGDVQNFEFPSGIFSHIIHAATPASAKLNTEDPLTMYNTIVDGTKRVLEFANQCRARKFLLTSSGAVYGKQPPQITHLTEEYSVVHSPQEPPSAYADGKRAAELFCESATSIEVKIARCFAFVGPHLPLDAHFAIGNFIQNTLRNEPIQVRGDGTPTRSYLYASDLMIWLFTILIKGVPGRPYNVGSEEDLTIADLASEVARSSGVQIKIEKKPVPGSVPTRYVPSTQRAQNELGLKTHIPLNVAIEKTIRWHREKDKS